MCVRACVLVLPAHSVVAVWSAWRGTFMGWSFTALWMKGFCLQNWTRSASGYLQNWEMGASIWAEAPPLEFSFWTWVGGTGLWDWPVARYIAWTHRIRSCSSSLANITVSPSFTALKKARPPSKPEGTTWEGGNTLSVPGCGHVVCVAAMVSWPHLAEGHYSPRCNHPAAAAPAVQTFSLCSCTWRTCTDLPTTHGLTNAPLIQASGYFFNKV